MIQRMETSLRSFGMTSAGHGGGLKDRAAARLAKCAHMLLLAFVENRASELGLAMSLALSLDREVDKKAQQVLISARDLGVSRGMHVVMREIDRLAVLCCVLLGELPPFNTPQQLRPTNFDRRGGVGSSSSGALLGSGAHGHLQLQLDIERMFSRRICIFTSEAVALSMDALVGAVLKASFKAGEQAIRTYRLGPLSSVQLTIDALFVKQVCSCFLKESNEDVEALADQVVQAINDADSALEPPAADAHLAIPKALADGMYSVSKTSILIRK